MFLLLYIDGGEPIDVPTICSGLENTNAAVKVGGSGLGCVATYEFHLVHISTLVRIDARSILIDGFNEASLEVAVEISRLCCRPLRITDDANAFDLSLRDFQGIEELSDVINNAGASRAAAYQARVAGSAERRITGNGEVFWTDGVDDRAIIEAKLLTSAERSPYLSGTTISDFLRGEINRRTMAEFARLAVILQDLTNPLTRVNVIVSDRRLIPFFRRQLKCNRLKGKVTVVPE